MERVINAPPSIASRTWKLHRILYVQVLAAVVLGVLLGHFHPTFGIQLKPFGDAFVRLVKMLIAPIVFCTVVHGIASLGDLKKVGRVGIKTILYFEVVSTLALVIGLLVVNYFQPGAGFNVDPTTLDPQLIQGYVQKAHDLSTTDFLLNIIPATFSGAFVNGDLLQVLFLAILTGFSITFLGPTGVPVLKAVDAVSRIFFAMMGLIVKFAPLGALGAMAFTVGSFGLASLQKLLALMAAFYLTSGAFVIVVLGSIAMLCGFSIFRFLLYIKDELLLVLGTSSSETALPSLMDKMRRLGCSRSTVGLVIPTGYSFNLDGTNIYMTMAAVFLAQATNTPLDFRHQIGLLLVAMLTSKGSSGVTGAGFVTLAATLAAVPSIPIQSLALLLGIDRFMSECRALTNLVGNGVATLVISRWEGEISGEKLRDQLNMENISGTQTAPTDPLS